MRNIRRVGVIGGGLMGSGIAEVCARAGRDVAVVESTDAAVDAARQRLEASSSAPKAAAGSIQRRKSSSGSA